MFQGAVYSGETCFQCKFIKRLHFSIVSRENLKIFQCKEKVKISFEVWMIGGYWKLIDFIFVYLFLSSANIENLFYAFNWFFFRRRDFNHGEPVHTKLCKNRRRQDGVQRPNYFQVTRRSFIQPLTPISRQKWSDDRLTYSHKLGKADMKGRLVGSSEYQPI